MTLAGRIIVVTGGSRGIGRACVLDAVARGARVIFCSRADGADSRDVEREAAAFAEPGAAVGVAADVTNERDVIRVFDTARERFGPVDGVVCNAAIGNERLLVSTTTREWDDVVAVNLTGPFLIARHALRSFLAGGRGGRIITIGTLSQYGVAGNAAYATSKGGLLGLTQELARQYARAGVMAAMVVPGYVETSLSAGMTETTRRALIDGCPQRRPGSPEEIASAVTFLLSDAAAGLNGRVLHVSGGLREVPL